MRTLLVRVMAASAIARDRAQQDEHTDRDDPGQQGRPLGRPGPRLTSRSTRGVLFAGTRGVVFAGTRGVVFVGTRSSVFEGTRSSVFGIGVIWIIHE